MTKKIKDGRSPWKWLYRMQLELWLILLTFLCHNLLLCHPVQKSSRPPSRCFAQGMLHIVRVSLLTIFRLGEGGKLHKLPSSSSSSSSIPKKRKLPASTNIIEKAKRTSASVPRHPSSTSVPAPTPRERPRSNAGLRSPAPTDVANVQKSTLVGEPNASPSRPRTASQEHQHKSEHKSEHKPSSTDQKQLPEQPKPTSTEQAKPSNPEQAKPSTLEPKQKNSGELIKNKSAGSLAQAAAAATVTAAGGVFISAAASGSSSSPPTSKVSNYSVT